MAWNGWSVTVYDTSGNVELKERHRNIRDLAAVVGTYAGKQIVHVFPQLSDDQKRELNRHAFRVV